MRKWENVRKEENRIYFGRESKQEHMKTTESTEINQVSYTCTVLKAATTCKKRQIGLH